MVLYVSVRTWNHMVGENAIECVEEKCMCVCACVCVRERG